MKHKISVVLGKFMPPHFGHTFMIRFALTFSEKVYLLVYTMKSEPLSGMERFIALTKHFQKEREEGRLIITWVEKDLPQTPEEHPDFWDIWKKEILYCVDPNTVDCFYGSEEYVKTLGEIFNCDHEIVDIQRQTVPTSGTLCRNSTVEHWENIIPEFRQHMVKKICFVGGESTGKSSLAAAMGEVFRTNHVHEYGREYCETKPPKEFTTDDFFKIGVEQIGLVLSAMKKSNRYIFCDTDAIVTQAFHKLYLGEFSDQLDSLIQKFSYDHYFLLAPVIDFYQDGTREFEHMRTKQFELLKFLLNKWGRKYTIIEEPDFRKRIEFVKGIVEAI